MLAGYVTSSFKRLWRLKTLPLYIKNSRSCGGVQPATRLFKYVAWQEMWLQRCKSRVFDEFLLVTSYNLTIS